MIGADLAGIDAHAQLIDISQVDCEESLYIFLKSAWHIWDSEPMGRWVVHRCDCRAFTGCR